MSQIVTLAELLARIEQLEAAQAMPVLPYSSLDDAAVPEKNADGVVRSLWGRQWDDTHGVADLTGPRPPRPSDPIVALRPGGADITWDGEFADGAVAPMDFAKVEIHLSTNPDQWDPLPYGTFGRDTIVGTIDSAMGGTLSLNLEPHTAFYVWLVARTRAGVGSECAPQSEGPEAYTVPVPTEGDLLAVENLAASKSRNIIQPIAPNAEDQLPQNLWIDTADGNNTPKRWDGTTWVVATDKMATDAAAAALTAQDTADAAYSVAADAGGTAYAALMAAGTAQASADGKNSIYRRTTTPNENGTRIGDLWWQYSDGFVIGQWVWGGSSWVETAMDGAVLANIDAAIITSGFIDSLRIRVNSILAEHLALGLLTNNLLLNPGFEDLGDYPPSVSASLNDVPHWTTGPAGHSQPYFFYWANPSYQARSGNGCAYLSSAGGTNGGRVQSAWVPVIPGQTYNIQAMVKNLHVACAARLAVYHNTTTSGTGTLVTIQTQSPTVAAEWTLLSGTWTAPAGRPWARVEVQNRGPSPAGAGHGLLVDEVSMTLNNSRGLSITPGRIAMIGWDGYEEAFWDMGRFFAQYGSFEGLGVTHDASIGGDLSAVAVRTPFLYLDDVLFTFTDWTDFTPTFTNFTLGNGTVNWARYRVAGGMVDVEVDITLGTTSSVTGNIYVGSLPAIGTGYSTLAVLGTAAFSRAAAVHLGVVTRSGSAGRTHLYNGTNTSASLPFSWTTGDRIQLRLRYNAA